MQVFHEESYLNTDGDETNQGSKWIDRIWVLSVAGQAGFLIAFPVLLGLAIGLFLDRQFGTYILFSILFSMSGFGAGIFLVYRWVKTTVRQRLDKMKKEE